MRLRTGLALQRRANFRHHNLKKCSEHLMFRAISLPNVRFATTACNFSTSELQKVLQTPHVLSIFTSTFAFRHSGVPFFDIRTSSSAPNTSCFVHFHVHMCFSATDSGVPTAKVQKVCRNTGILHICACKRASRYSGVQFFDIITSKSGPNTSCFVQFHFQMCVSPQRRAIFRHQNFKKCSKHLMF